MNSRVSPSSQPRGGPLSRALGEGIRVPEFSEGPPPIPRGFTSNLVTLPVGLLLGVMDHEVKRHPERTGEGETEYRQTDRDDNRDDLQGERAEV